MGLPNETSLQCIMCGVFNFDDGIILKGEIICWDCIKKPRFNKIKI